MTAGWVESAACTRGVNPDVFFDDTRVVAAVEVCQRCQARPSCLTYAIDNQIRDGVWGGLTPTQRQRLTRPAHNRRGVR